MVGIYFYAGYWTNHYALRLTKVSYAFSAKGRFDLINFNPLIDSAIWAFRLTDVTVYAFACDSKSHLQIPQQFFI